MVLNALALKPKREARRDFRGRHFEDRPHRAGGLLAPALRAQLFRGRFPVRQSRAIRSAAFCYASIVSLARLIWRLTSS
jgi:hypothetical protein